MHRSRDSVVRPPEDHEECVALGLDLDTLAGRDGLAQQAVVLGQQVAVGVGAQRLQKPRGTFDIGEQDRHRARG
jgi:hypothetical protein